MGEVVQIPVKQSAPKLSIEEVCRTIVIELKLDQAYRAGTIKTAIEAVVVAEKKWELATESKEIQIPGLLSAEQAEHVKQIIEEITCSRSTTWLLKALRERLFHELELASRKLEVVDTPSHGA